MLLESISESLERLGIQGERISVAISGGVDSSVLLYALKALASSYSLEIQALHVNHGLRGEESEQDQRSVAEFAAEMGIPFLCRRIEVETGAEASSNSRDRFTLQEAARALRYEALFRMARESQSTRLATAHHATDQAETVLLRLLRGAGPDGLGGIPESSQEGFLIRPMLKIPREDVEKFAELHRISWREDASNQDRKYTRNRLRHEWLNRLQEEFNPQLVRTLCQLAEAQQKDSEWIESLVEMEWQRRFSRQGEEICLEECAWNELPEALATRLIHRTLRELGVGRLISSLHLKRAADFLRNGRKGKYIELPGGLRLIRESWGFRWIP